MATKMSAGVMTKDTFCHLMTELRKADAKKDAAVGECRAIRKRMKSQGVDLDALALMQSLAKLEPDDAAARIKNLWRYRDWNGDGVQLPLPLFGADDDEPSSAVMDEMLAESVAIAEARQAGHAHGVAGGTMEDCPFVGELAAAWIEGFQAGQVEATAPIAPAVKRASTRRQMAESNAPVQ